MNENHDIEFNREGNNLILSCSLCGVFYNKKKSSKYSDDVNITTQEVGKHYKEKNHHGAA